MSKRRLAQPVEHDYDTVYTENVERIFVRELGGQRRYDLHSPTIITFSLDAATHSLMIDEVRRILPYIDALPIGKINTLRPTGTMTWRWLKGRDTFDKKGADSRELLGFSYPADVMPEKPAANLPVWANSDYDLYSFAADLHIAPERVDGILGPNRTMWNEDRKACQKHVEAVLTLEGTKNVTNNPDAPVMGGVLPWTEDPARLTTFWAEATKAWVLWHADDPEAGNARAAIQAWVLTIAGVTDLKQFVGAGKNLLSALWGDAKARAIIQVHKKELGNRPPVEPPVEHSPFASRIRLVAPDNSVTELSIDDLIDEIVRRITQAPLIAAGIGSPLQSATAANTVPASTGNVLTEAIVKIKRSFNDKDSFLFTGLYTLYGNAPGKFARYTIKDTDAATLATLATLTGKTWTAEPIGSEMAVALTATYVESEKKDSGGKPYHNLRGLA